MNTKFKLKLLSSTYTFFILLLLMTSSSLFAQRYYWVGKGVDMNWGNIENWSKTSGGPGGASGGVGISPAATNTVVFDVNSGLTSIRKTITIGGAVNCDSLIVEAACPEAPIFNMGSNVVNYINVAGSFLLKRTGVLFSSVFDGNSGGDVVRFVSNRTNETIQTNGTVMGTPVGYNTSVYIGATFAGSGSWQLIDEFTTGGSVNVESGTLDLNGNNITVHRVNATGGKMIFPNVTITCHCHWNYTGAALALTPAETSGSLIRVGIGSMVAKAGDIYHNVEFFAGNPTSPVGHDITNGTFNKITYLLSGGNGFIGNTSVTLITDSLVIQGTNTYTFFRVTVNKYFEAKPGVACGGQLRLCGYYQVGYITMGASAMVNVERAVIHDMEITGGLSRNAVNSYDWGNNGTGWNFVAWTPVPHDMYWIGGSGWWNDPTHWSFSSGGSPANCLPSLADNVFFDGGSGDISGSANAVKMNGDAWCNDMTWNGASGNPYFCLYGTASASAPPECYYYSKLMIGGSLELQNSMSITGGGYAYIYFVSDRPTETIVTNNCSIGTHTYFQSPSGDGGWKVTGTLNMSARTISFFRGHLDLSGQQVFAQTFESPGDNTTPGFTGYLSSRTLNIAGAVINLGYAWSYIGGQPLTAAQSTGSSILAGISPVQGYIYTKCGDEYYNAEIRTAGSIEPRYPTNAAGAGLYTTFNKITLSGTSATININNTTYQGIVRPDSLLLTGNGTYTIDRSFMVNQYLGTPLECGGHTNLTADSPVTITMGNSLPKIDRVKVRNTAINNISITTTPPDGEDYDVIDCTRQGTSNGWIITNLPPETYYWVGGTGNWSDQLHWADASNGTPGSGCVPRPVDNVIFDDYSFTASYQLVTVDVTAHCDSMSWIGNASLMPSLWLSSSLYINGSLEFQKGMFVSTNTFTDNFNFTSSRPDETIRCNDVVFSSWSRIVFDGTGGWKLLDKLTTNYYIEFEQGSWDFNGQAVTMGGFLNGSVANRNNRYLDMRNSTVTVGAAYVYWNYTGNLQADNSTIHFKANTSGYPFTAEAGVQYHNLVLNTTASINVNNGIFNKVTANFSTVFNGIETDTLQLANDANYEYQFMSGTTLTVHKAFFGSGTPCNSGLILRSTAENTPAIFDIRRAAANYDETFMVDEADTLLIDFARIHGIKALNNPAVNAMLYKGKYSADEDKSGAAWGFGKGLNNYNEDWCFMEEYDPGTPRPFNGDRKLPCDAVPYKLSSVGFLPPPGSTFKWRKGTLANPVVGTDDYLMISEAGRYILTVDYGNTCLSTDSLEIAIASSDSLIWTGAVSKDWNDPLNWNKPGGGGVSDYAPDACTNVLIRDGLSRYPNLTPVTGTDYTQELYEKAACLNIHFEHGGEVVRTDSLHYSKAFVQLALAANRWYMLSPPLNSMFPGDYYISNPNPIADNLIVYTQLFARDNPQTLEPDVNATGGWTGLFNTPSVPMPAGFGLAVWFDDGTADNVHNTTAIWLPKHDLIYKYYYEDGTPTGEEVTIPRLSEHRFVYEPVWDKTLGEITLDAKTSGGGNDILVGNPFMAHWDFTEFQLKNPLDIKHEYKFHYPGDAAFTTWTPTVPNGLTKMIAPMQSILLTSLRTFTELKTDVFSTESVPYDKLRRSESDINPALLSIVATMDDSQNSTAVLFDESASNDYLLSEDSYKLFVKSATKPVAVYTRSEDGYALDINLFGDCTQLIPIGLRTNQTGIINLRFEGIETFLPGYDVFLLDIQNGNAKINLKQTPVYSVEKTTSDLFMDGRLYLSFNRTGTGITDVAQSTVSISNHGNQLQVISGNSMIKEVQVIDMQGRIILKETNIEKSVYTHGLERGMYVVKVATGDGWMIRRIKI